MRSSPLIEIGKDFPFYVMAQGVYALAGLVGLSVYTRLLQPTEYGLYVLISATISLLELIAFGWINQAFLRYFTEHAKARTLSLLFAHLIILFGSVLFVVSGAWLVLSFVIDSFQPRLARLLRIGLIALGARASFSLALTLVRAERLTLRYSLYVAMGTLGGVAIAWVFLIVFQRGIEGIIYGISIAMFLPLCGELIRLRRAAPEWSGLSLEYSRKWFRYGIPLAGASVGALWLSLGDRYLIQYFLGSQEVGIYAAGYDLVDKSLKVVFSLLPATAYPVLLQTLSEDGAETANHLLMKVVKLSLLFMPPVALGVIALRHELISLFLGSSFGETSRIVPWIAIGTLFWGMSQVISLELQIHERTGPLFSFLLTAVALNAALNIILIPGYGIAGAAVATVVAYAGYLAAIVWKAGRGIQFVWNGLGGTVWKVGFGIALMGVMVEMMRDTGNHLLTVVVKGAVGGITYLTVLVLLEKRTLRMIRKDKKPHTQKMGC